MGMACPQGELSHLLSSSSSGLRLPKAVAACANVDVTKKPTARKGKYVCLFPGRVTAAAKAATRFGQILDIHSKHPTMYIDFPQGRLKLVGEVVHPQRKLITLQFNEKKKSVLCEDVFESAIVFSEAAWVGTRLENAQEGPLQIPAELVATRKSAKVPKQQSKSPEASKTTAVETSTAATPTSRRSRRAASAVKYTDPGSDVSSISSTSDT